MLICVCFWSTLLKILQVYWYWSSCFKKITAVLVIRIWRYWGNKICRENLDSHLVLGSCPLEFVCNWYQFFASVFCVCGFVCFCYLSEFWKYQSGFCPYLQSKLFQLTVRLLPRLVLSYYNCLYFDHIKIIIACIYIKL